MKLLISLLLLSMTLFSQTSSAFSKKNSLGLKQNNNSIFLSAKGNAGLSSYNALMINPSNSATWVHNPYTLLDFSVRSSSTNVDANSQKVTFSNTSLGGINWVSQVMDSTLSIGMTLSPYLSRNGSFLDQQESVGLDTFNLNLTFFNEYEGSISEFKFGTAYKFSSKLSLSADLLYYFGSLNREAKIAENGSSILVQSNEKIENAYYGFTFGLNALYQITDDLNIALQFSPSTRLNRDSEGIIVTTSNVDSYDITDGNEIEIPSKFAIGLGKTIKNFGKLYADYHVEDWALNNTKSSAFHIGYESFASKKPFDPLLKKTMFFMGAYYYNEAFNYNYLENAQAESVQNMGFSAGTSIPFNANRNFFSFALSYTKRGDSSKNGVSESIFAFNIGISLGEWWYLPEIDD